jgi:RNAse (barnase) inhibitor barstar
MLVIELDAKKWNCHLDFYQDLNNELGSPKKHGSSIAAFIDSIVYGGMNKVIPPFRIEIRNFKILNHDLAKEIVYDIFLINRHIESKNMEKEIEIRILPDINDFEEWNFGVSSN